MKPEAYCAHVGGTPEEGCGYKAGHVGPHSFEPARLYVVEWNPVDDTYLVGIFTSETKARAAFDSFQPPQDQDGWVFLNEYESDRVNPLEIPKQLAERRIE